MGKQLTEVELMLAVIWKKLDQVERVANDRGARLAPIATYFEELKKAVEKERGNISNS